jgi:hypothetical protein
MSEASGKTVWRSNSQVIAAVAFGGFAVVIGIAELGRPASRSGGPVTAAVFIGLGALMIAVFVRVAVVTSNSGVRIRNPVGTIVLTWGEIAGFRIGRHRLLSAVCIVDLVNGEQQYAFGIQAAHASHGRREREKVRALSQMADAHKNVRP